MGFRIVQVSDLHLSRDRAYFFDNWDVFVGLIRDDPPDLVVVSGDLSFDGWGDPAALAFAREQIARLEVPVRILPGNHDIGESPAGPRPGRAVTKAHHRRFLDLFGEDRWTIALGEWTLIGIDSEIFQSGLDAEAAQRVWLEATLAGTAGPVALFMHKPLYLDDPEDERVTAGWCDPLSRRWLFGLIERHDVRVVGSGHLHIWRHVRHGDTDIVWAPSTSFVNADERKPDHGGTHRVGFVEYRLEGAEAEIRFVEPALFANIDLRNWFRSGRSALHLPPRPLCRTSTESG
ncbi:MAG: metallophosphoesterase [Alphaproteobacteria bacterium]|nr:metallophosphoesterase [Alphaproteobacteria bacterium]